MLDVDEIALVEASLNDGLIVQLVVDACRFACCGKPFRERAGYEQVYTGTIAHVELNGLEPIAVRMNGLGMGTPSFIVEAGVENICLVRQRPRPAARYG
jgi:hypothetical protein